MNRDESALKSEDILEATWTMFEANYLLVALLVIIPFSLSGDPKTVLSVLWNFNLVPEYFFPMMF